MESWQVRPRSLLLPAEASVAGKGLVVGEPSRRHRAGWPPTLQALLRTRPTQNDPQGKACGDPRHSLRAADRETQGPARPRMSRGRDRQELPRVGC